MSDAFTFEFFVLSDLSVRVRGYAVNIGNAHASGDTSARLSVAGGYSGTAEGLVCRVENPSLPPTSNAFFSVDFRVSTVPPGRSCRPVQARNWLMW
jgi:hypothetical protein